MAIFQKWEDYNLPNIRIGKQRNQSNSYDETTPFDGPFFREKKTDDTVTTWQCSIVCDMRQSRVFKDFLYSVVGTNSNYFYKNMKTERSNNPQLVRIISGIPQPQQISHNSWKYSFTLEAANFTFTEDEITFESELPENYIRNMDTLESMIRGVAGGTPNNDVSTISLSRDRSTVVYGFLGGGASLSRNLGSSWQPLPVSAVSGGSLQDVLSSAISDDAKKIIFGMSSGYGAISNDGGVSMQSVQRGFGLPTASSSINTISMSGDGQVVFVGGSNGEISVSVDGGDVFSGTSSDFGTGNAGLNFTCSSISRDGKIIIAGTSQGYAIISINKGTSFTSLPYGLVSGGPSSGITIYDCAMSDSGAVSYFLMRDTVNNLTLIARTGTFGSSYEYTGDIPGSNSSVESKTISCSPDGSAVFANYGTRVYESYDFSEIYYLIPYEGYVQFLDATVVESDGQSLFVGFQSGYAQRDVPSPLDIEGITPIDEERIEVVTDVTPSSIPAGAGTIINSLGHAHTYYAKDEPGYLIGMSGGYILQTDDLSEPFLPLVNPFGENSDVSQIECSFSQSVIFASVGTSLPVSYDKGVSYVNSQIAITADLGSTYPATSIGMSNNGDLIFAALTGEPGEVGIGMISNDYAKNFSQVESGFNAMIEVVADSIISSDGQHIFVVENSGRAALSEDGGNTFNPVTRWQNSGASVTSNLSKVCGSKDGSVIYVFYDDGYAAVSMTNGVGWAPLPRWSGKDSVPLNDVDCSNSGEYIIAVYDNGEFTVSYDFGQTWQDGPLTIPELVPENLTKIKNADSQWMIATDQGKLFIGEQDVIIET